MRIRNVLLAMGASLGLVLTVPGAANASHATGSASVSNSYGRASASWTWQNSSSLSKISLHVKDANCNSNPVYAYFRVTRSNGNTWHTSTHRYDYNGCNGGGTTHPGLSLSDGYHIKYIAIRLCNDEWGTDPCTTGSNSAANPHA